MTQFKAYRLKVAFVMLCLSLFANTSAEGVRVLINAQGLTGQTGVVVTYQVVDGETVHLKEDLQFPYTNAPGSLLKTSKIKHGNTEYASVCYGTACLKCSVSKCLKSGSAWPTAQQYELTGGVLKPVSNADEVAWLGGPGVVISTGQSPAALSTGKGSTTPGTASASSTASGSTATGSAATGASSPKAQSLTAAGATGATDTKTSGTSNSESKLSQAKGVPVSDSSATPIARVGASLILATFLVFSIAF